MSMKTQSLSQDNNKKEETNIDNIDGKTDLHNGTLKRYQLNFPEQAEKIQTMLNWIEVLRNFANNKSRQLDEYSTVGEIIESLSKTSYDAYKSSGTPEADLFITLVDFTVDIEGAEVLQKVAQICFKNYYNKGAMLDFTCFDRLNNVLGTIQWLSDFHCNFCTACANAGVIPMCLENIKRIDAGSSNWENGDGDSTETVRIIYRCVGILHNISRWLRDPELFTNCVATLLYFAKVKVPKVATASLLGLAYLVNEETNHLILADEHLLNFIITLLNEAWQSDDHRSNGFSTKELAEGLSHLAINDTNKKVLGQKGAVQVLTSVLLASRDDEERAITVKALWMLAFDDGNKEAIRKEDGALKALRQLQHSKDLEVRKAATGALWELEGKTARNLEKRETTGNHVMISYQWDSQDVLIEVKNRLQASGYRVWMDLEQMGGSTLEAMAKAVENASVVLVCMSQRYKESPNCRSDAEYAYQLRKDIIPLMMQHNYKADGWLGMLVGTKLWIDFQSKYVIEAGAEKLIKELGGRGRDVDMTDGPSEPVVGAVQKDVVARQPSTPSVSGWTNKEVKQWLKEIGLEKVCKKGISEMNGQTLIDLQQLRGECPEHFYRCLEQNLKLRNMIDMFKFRMELAKLLGY